MTVAVATSGLEGEHAVAGSCEPAGFAARAMAYLIDLSLLLIFAFVLLLGAGLRLWHSFPSDLTGLIGASLVVLTVLIVVVPLLFFSYFVLLHAGCGQTVGKMVMGLRLVADDGGPVGLGQAFLRASAALLSALPLGAGFLWAVLDRKQRTWHDLIAATRVICV